MGGRSGGAAALCLLLAAAVAPAAAPSGLTAALDAARGRLQAGDLQGAVDAWAAIVADPLATEAERATAHNNACVALIRLGRPVDAVAQCTLALDLRTSLGDARGASKTLSNLGWAERVAGLPEEAKAHYLRALALARAEHFAESEAVILGNLGTLALRTGDPALALTRYREAAEVASARADEPWAAEQRAVALTNQGTVLEKLGQYREALTLYDALEGVAMTPGLRATFTLNRGTLFRNLEVPSEAARLFQQAADLYAAQGNLQGQAAAAVNLGLLRLDNLGQPAEAVAPLQEASRLAEAARDRGSALLAAYHLGRALTALGRLDEAEILHRDGLQRAETSGEPEVRWAHAHGLGLVAEARGDLAGAWEHDRTALDLIGAVRDRLVDPDQSEDFLAARRPLFDAAVRVLTRLHALEPGAGHAAAALGVVQQAKETELRDAVGASSPPRSAAAIIDAVDAVGGARLLEYYVAADRVYLLDVHRGRVDAHDLGDRAEVMGPVRSVRRALARGARVSEADIGRLSALLLGPVAEVGDRLYVAADDELRHVPFDLLGDPPLVEGTTLVHLSSASALDASPTPAAHTWRFLGVAAPGPGPAPQRDALHLTPLVHAREEVQRAARQLGGATWLLIDEDATPMALGGLLRGGADVLHLAAHTVMDDGPGGVAAILLAPDLTHADGALGAREIARMEISAYLVVLASCRSALGPGDAGHTLHTVTGGFLAAGTSAVIATLWDVDDASTAVIMEQLYHQLAAGLAPAEALRQAKLRVRETPGWEDPGRWAAFVIVGEAPPVGQGRSWWLPVVLGLLTLGALGWWVQAGRSGGPEADQRPDQRPDKRAHRPRMAPTSRENNR